MDVVKLHIHHRRARECHTDAGCRGCGERRLLAGKSFDLPRTLGDEPALMIHCFTVILNITAVQPLGAQDYLFREAWVLRLDPFADEAVHFRLLRHFPLFPLRR